MRVHRRPLIPFLALAVVFSVAGCAPPAPSPAATTTFASDEEAFAAAEETYRGYIAAGNDGTDATRFLIGPALASEIDLSRTLSDQNLAMVGASGFDHFVGVDATVNVKVATVVARVCLDVSDTRIIDEGGADVTPESRADRWLLSITFVGDKSGLLISDSTADDDDGSC
ncbi:hypothetical protein SRABI44_02238 [Microbacterium foliorum]|nr:hypothetical protein SRABI03_01533 [Microbacterium foliorum]CAH0213753.1 hypothetical protein SRABI44_02238 [Microbacterium foliorum]